jgi:hypothetical protein
MKRSKVIEISKEILENFNQQIKKYELDVYDQIQVLRTAVVTIEEETHSIRYRQMNKEILNAVKSKGGKI